MKLTRYFIPTMREEPADAEIVSHKLMIRSGMIRKVAAGIYDFLPTGLRVIRKVENIVREELNRAGAIETLLPSMVPSELWRESGRWDVYGKELLRIKDRHDHEFCYGPTHEEVMTDIVRRDVRSYKQLPLNLYQIQTKFRDEIRPRFGVMRSREFMMKDGYSYDRDEEGAAKSYEKMHDAYSRVFERSGLKFRVVEADPGNIGGSSSHEFMVLADSGEDLVVSCPSCDYASNAEKAEVAKAPSSSHLDKTMLPIQEVKTPGTVTIGEVSEFLNKKPREFIKTLVYSVNGGSEYVMVIVRGDCEINEPKLSAVLGADMLELAEHDKVKELTGTSVGFLGPVLNPDRPYKSKMRIIADHSIKSMVNAVTGANKDDYHLININTARDFTAETYADIRMVKEGDYCPRCKKSAMEFHRGIEVGHIFRLGTKYSKAMNATYLDENGKEQIIVMGTYGIGIGRIAAAAIEQSHDDNGIIWPWAIAPFQIIVLPLNVKKEFLQKAAAEIENELEGAGYEVLHDDRNERAGIKFNDADLIGVPVQVIVGEKGLKNGEVEIKVRKTGERHNVKRDSLLDKIKEITTDLSR